MELKFNLKFNKSRNRTTGEPTEREFRRKGDLLAIIHLAIGDCMFWEYENGGMTRTSLVEMIKETESELEVTTMNTIYTFKKIK